MAKHPFTEEEIRRFLYPDAMRGIGFDIANSRKIPQDEKDSLIKAVEEWWLHNGTFSNRQRSLLYRIRNEYHISNSSLRNECKPDGLLDKILW